MEKEYKENRKEYQKFFKKYQKALIKMVIAGMFIPLGLLMPGAPILDFLGAFIAKHEVATFVCILVKVALTLGGIYGVIVNGIKAHINNKKMQDSNAYEEEIVDYITKELKVEKEKNRNLKEELSEVKSKTKIPEKAQNASKDTDYQDDKEYEKEKTRIIKK